MSNDNPDEAVQLALRAVFKIVGDRELQAKLRDDESAQTVLSDLGLSQTARPALLTIVGRIEQFTDQRPLTQTYAGARTSESNIEKMLLESFVHIRWSFWISLIMSVVLFVVGLIFLGIAVMRSLNEAAVSTATLTIAGLGLADFVLLFYTRPWQDISVNLSNSQQVKIIATSYLSGLSLLQQGKTEEFALLEQLTKNAISLLEEFTEERPAASTKTADRAES